MRTAAWLAWSSFSLFVVLVALDLFLGSRTAPEHLLGLAVNGLLALPFPAMGALLASRRPDNPIGWLFCLSAILLGLSDVGGRYGLDAIVAEPGALPGGVVAASVRALDRRCRPRTAAVRAPALSGRSPDVRQAIDDLRELAHGIHPPVLSDRGLLEATSKQRFSVVRHQQF